MITEGEKSRRRRKKAEEIQQELLDGMERWIDERRIGQRKKKGGKKRTVFGRSRRGVGEGDLVSSRVGGFHDGSRRERSDGESGVGCRGGKEGMISRGETRRTRSTSNLEREEKARETYWKGTRQ